MLSTKSLVLSFAATLMLRAQTPTTVRVSTETVPAGGMAQVKVLLTSPQPITGGGMKFDGAMSLADGISLFSQTGDVFGTAVQNESNIDVRFISPNGTFGTNEDYPMMTVTFGMPANAFKGQTSSISLGSASYWQNALGLPVPVEMKPGTITVGGSISITNVLPGGGRVPAGGTFRILGVGFGSRTQIALKGVKTSAITYINSNEIRVTLKEAVTMDSLEIQAKNPDGSSSDYFSYLRGVPVGGSTNALIASALPIFSTKTSLSSTLPALMLPQINSPYVVGLAVQNPGPAPADITLSVHSASGQNPGDVHITLAPGEKMSRELSEWSAWRFPGAPTFALTRPAPCRRSDCWAIPRTAPCNRSA